MRTNSRPRVTLLALGLLLLPLLVGFETPDSTGHFARVAAGRGGYHLTGCHRHFDSEYGEVQLGMRHRVATAAPSPEDSRPWWKPTHYNVGYFANITSEKLTIVKPDTNSNDSIGDSYREASYAGGLHGGFEWPWVAANLGLAGLKLLRDVKDFEMEKLYPIAGLRLGPEWLFASGEIYSSSPLYSGGGGVKAGFGGRYRSTRLWAGIGSVPYQNTMGIVRVTQGFGPVTVAATVMGNSESIPPAGIGIDNEEGMSLGVEYRLP